MRAGIASSALLRPLPTGLLYYRGVRCPSCGSRHFLVGRVTAECVRCDAALIITDADRSADIQEN